MYLIHGLKFNAAAVHVSCVVHCDVTHVCVQFMQDPLRFGIITSIAVSLPDCHRDIVVFGGRGRVSNSYC